MLTSAFLLDILIDARYFSVSPWFPGKPRVCWVYHMPLLSVFGNSIHLVYPSIPFPPHSSCCKTLTRAKEPLPFIDEVPVVGNFVYYGEKPLLSQHLTTLSCGWERRLQVRDWATRTLPKTCWLPNSCWQKSCGLGELWWNVWWNGGLALHAYLLS